MRVVLIGAGGHAHVVADIILSLQAAGTNIELAGFVDDDAALRGQRILGARVLGAVSDLASFDHDAVLSAIGSNAGRAEVFMRLAGRERFAVLVHPRATIAADVAIGEGSVACAGSVVNTSSIIGRNVILNTGCTVDHHARLGDHVHIGPGAHLAGGVSVGDRAFVGMGALVLPGRTVGGGATVGAGAVVTVDVAPGCTVVGIPAHPHTIEEGRR